MRRVKRRGGKEINHKVLQQKQFCAILFHPIKRTCGLSPQPDMEVGSGGRRRTNQTQETATVAGFTQHASLAWNWTTIHESTCRESWAWGTNQIIVLNPIYIRILLTWQPCIFILYFNCFNCNCFNCFMVFIVVSRPESLAEMGGYRNRIK